MQRILCIALLFITLAPAQAAYSGGLLTGVTRLSCEALLCLSSGVRPGACSAALSYYFAIKKITWPATFAARLKFLNKCPTGSPGLARAIASGAGRCEIKNLTTTLNAMSRWVRYDEDEVPDVDHFLNATPSYCIAYFNHPLTSGFNLPKYKKVCADPDAPAPAYGFGMGTTPALQKPCYLKWGE